MNNKPSNTLYVGACGSRLLRLHADFLLLPLFLPPIILQCHKDTYETHTSGHVQLQTVECTLAIDLRSRAKTDASPGVEQVALSHAAFTFPLGGQRDSFARDRSPCSCMITVLP
jgi:hypothetical protein